MCLCQVFLITSLVSLGRCFTNVHPLYIPPSCRCELEQMWMMSSYCSWFQTQRTLSPCSPYMEWTPANPWSTEESLVRLSSDGFDLLLSTCIVSSYKYQIKSLSLSLCLLVPLPPAGELRITEVTHSSMRLTWDAAPGNVRKYIITYKREDGELKEVIKIKIFRTSSNKKIKRSQFWKRMMFDFS